MIEVTVCVGSTCYLKGSYNVINKLTKLINKNELQDKVVIKGACCLGNCSRPVSVKINDGDVFSMNESEVDKFFKEEVLDRLEKEE